MERKDRAMKKHERPLNAAELRHRAESTLRERKKKATTPPATSADSRRLVHELEVHQIELEMQNEELRRVQEELEESRAKYFDLYDLAPVGYLLLGAHELILEANLAAARLLGVEKGQLVNKAVTRFIAREDQDIYYVHRQKLLRNARAAGVRAADDEKGRRPVLGAAGREPGARCRGRRAPLSRRDKRYHRVQAGGGGIELRQGIGRRSEPRAPANVCARTAASPAPMRSPA